MEHQPGPAHPFAPVQQTVPGEGAGPSPELLAAQARLLALRAAQGIAPAGDLGGRQARAERQPLRSDPDAPNWELRNAMAALQQRRAESGIGNDELRVTNDEWGIAVPGSQPLAPNPQPPIPSPQPLLVAHPTMLLAMLRQGQEAPGRVWLLLRAMDTGGRGWVTVEAARERLATNGSPWRCCGWRRLRQILAQGEGVFWQRDDRGRLWLRGAHRVAHALGCERLQGFPVELPVTALLGGIRDVRAAFYAAFHSGRDGQPISRETLRALSGVAERTQPAYDRAARVRSRRNLAIADRRSTRALQERAWQRGRAVFTFLDVNGRQGPKGGEYVAWHLPNSYEGPHARRSRGSRKRLNRKLADLVHEGIPGNGGPPRGGPRIERVFWPDGAAAAKHFNRDPEADAYWAHPQRDHRQPTGGAAIWGVLTQDVATHPVLTPSEVKRRT